MPYYAQAMDEKARALEVLDQYHRSPPMSRARLGVDDTVLGATDAVRDGAAYWVSADIWAAIDTSAVTMPRDFAPGMDLLPQPCGFVWVDRLATPLDALCAFAWSPVWFEGAPAIGVYAFEHAPRGPLLRGSICWSVGDTVTAHERALRRISTSEELFRLGRAALAFFLWVQQTIVVARETPLERHAARRVRDVAMEKRLHVVTLRRAAATAHGDDSGGEPVAWSCRWVVRGHWRQQYLPSSARHRPTFILPHVKGPEDKPLKAPDATTLFKVTR